MLKEKKTHLMYEKISLTSAVLRVSKLTDQVYICLKVKGSDNGDSF